MNTTRRSEHSCHRLRASKKDAASIDPLFSYSTCDIPAAGCTLTVALVTDWLLTVASVGDSKAVLDTGAQFMDLSPEHRVQHHLAEQSRLKAAGTYIAPISVYMDGAAEPDEPGYGPLRAWPGGLCVSR